MTDVVFKVFLLSWPKILIIAALTLSYPQSERWLSMKWLVSLTAGADYAS